MDNTEYRYLQWLVREIGNWTTYHNHKETMAWAATGLYIPGIIILAVNLKTDYSNYWPFFIVAFVLVMFFVHWQFYLRAKAADTNDALVKLIQDVYQGCDFHKENHSIKKGKHWPQFVENKIEAMKGHGRSWTDTLFTDWTSYLAIIFTTFTALLLLRSDPISYVVLDTVVFLFLIWVLVEFVLQKCQQSRAKAKD